LRTAHIISFVCNPAGLTGCRSQHDGTTRLASRRGSDSGQVAAAPFRRPQPSTRPGGLRWVPEARSAIDAAARELIYSRAISRVPLHLILPGGGRVLHVSGRHGVDDAATDPANRCSRSWPDCAGQAVPPIRAARGMPRAGARIAQGSGRACLRPLPLAHANVRLSVSAGSPRPAASRTAAMVEGVPLPHCSRPTKAAARSRGCSQPPAMICVSHCRQ